MDSSNRDNKSIVVSLSDRRRRHNNIVRKEVNTELVRIRDLEIEVIKLQDVVLELSETLEELQNSHLQLLRLLKKCNLPRY